MKRKVVFILIMTLILTFVLCSCGGTPEEKIKECLETGNYVKAVEIYNENSLENEEEVEAIICDMIDTSVENWSAETISYDEVKEFLQAFSSIDNKELVDSAEDKLNFITIEDNGNCLYEEAEIYYGDGDYLSAMKSICEIDYSYSLYDSAQSLYGDAKAAYIMQISYPTSLEEYEANLTDLESFLGTYSDDELSKEKARLEDECEVFKKTIVIIDKADNYYNEGKYKNAFTTLEDGIEKYPEDRHLPNKYDELGSLYIITITQQVTPLVEEEEYKEAVEIIEKAQDAYDCEAFEQLEDAVKDEKSILHRWSSAVVDKFVVFTSGWNEEVLEVKKDGAIPYIEKSGEKLLLGNYSEKDVTLLSTAGNVGIALAGFDAPMDIRDLTYDIQHWGEEEYFVLHLATDAIALVPVIGAIKYAKYMKKANLTDDVTEIAIKGAVNYAETTTGIIKHRQYVKTINQHLKGQKHPISGVKFVESKVDYSDGRKLLVVVPKFDYVVQYKLPEKAWLLSRESHNKTLNNRLLNQIEKNDKLKAKFTAEQIEDLKNGSTPRGLTWHHTEEEGVMQLVDSEIHDITKHTGGYSLWGKGAVETSNE